VPVALLEERVSLRNATVYGEHQAHSELSHSVTVHAGAVGNVHAALRAVLPVDRVEASTGADDQGEVGGCRVNSLCWNFRRPNDEHFRLMI